MRISCFFLLLSCWSFGLSAQAPLLTIKNDSVAIVTRSLVMNVDIIDNTAMTTVALEFFNPTDRILEGELNFPLADGQRVFQFAMDVNGKMRESVIVEKQEGRVAFENIVRQTIDPGLLEITQGNNYRARVYPIPAKGTKRIKISFEQEIVGDNIFSIAIDYGLVDNFALNVFAPTLSSPPEVVSGGFDLDFKRDKSGFSSRLELSNVLTKDAIGFKIPGSVDDVVLVDQSKNDSSFFKITIPTLFDNPVKALPRNLVIFWDASLSLATKDLNKELELLDSYFQKNRSLTVRLISFSNNVIVDEKHHITEGNWAKLRHRLEQTIFDGATNPAILNQRKIRADEAFLFTDGLFTLGKLSTKTLFDFPVFTINSKTSADHEWLRQFAAREQGLYFDLTQTTVISVLNLLTESTKRFISATYSANISNVYPEAPQPIGKVFSAAGVLKGSHGEVTFNFGVGDKILYRKTILIDRKASTTTDLSRVWAVKYLDHLSQDSETNKRAIITLAKNHSLITPFTSMIILDRLEDYVRYRITPPEELMEEYSQRVSEEEEESEDEAYDSAGVFELAIEEYNDHIDWWVNNDTDSIQNITPAPAGREPTSTIETLPNDSATETLSDTTASFFDGQQNIPTTAPAPVVTLSAPDPSYTRTLSGVITDETGSPLPGVNVLLKGTSHGTITDVEGRYSIAVPDGGVLIISFIGYQSSEVNYGANDVADISLQADISRLEEVVTVGYGVTRRNLSVAVMTTTIEGSVAGLSVLGANPLYVVDGVPTTKTEADALRNEGKVDEVNIINASNGVAIYGARAADGVVVMTTVGNQVEVPDSVSGKFESFELQEWVPSTPYIDSLRHTKPIDRYNRYLALRAEYQNTPSFFLITGNFFIENDDSEHGIRILSNIAELKLDNHEMLKILSYRFSELGETASAIFLLEKIKELRGEEPHSYRDLALLYAEAGQYQQAFDNLMAIVSMDFEKGELENRFPLLKTVVIDEINNLLSKHKRKIEYSSMPKELIKPMPVDIRVVLDWNALETDIDMWVTEPSGEQCDYKNHLTRTGGKLVEDYTEGYGPEVFMIKNAPAGKYEISVDFFDERSQKLSGPVTLHVSIFTHYGTKKQSKKQFTLQLENEEEESLKVAEIDFK